ncbi:MAG TPA: type IVB secretion system protein IcmH/DotU [Steroidobacteraceae bacterium]|nr:type IVB secretion system protein IcmH/DotU [Steroidobacteraceae bacterium]
MTTGNDNDGTPRNKTLLRPQPGGRGSGRPSAPGPSLGAMPSVAPAPGSPTATVEEFITRGGNPLVAAAGPLLMLGAAVGSMVYQADVEGLRRKAVESVQSFELQARAAGVDPNDVTVARYVICTFLDSAIFQTPWGGQNVWGARSLLMTFHNEAHGGEKFFTILERMRQDPARYLNLLELQYICLALGFQGKYRLEPNSRAVVQMLQDDLYRLIRARNPGIGAVLSSHWQGVKEPKARAFRLVPWWVVVAGAAAILLSVLIFLRSRLSDQAAPVVAALAVRGVDTGYEAPPPPAPSRLKQLLAEQEQRGELGVEEFGARTVVTLKAPELFQSGSTQIAAGQVPLFTAIGRALEAVPGRILVVGHTDDQPLRSFRYADNFELSRERAVAVAQLLKPSLSNFSRVEWTGLGSTQPRYLPASSPENRVRNRRVEIVHTAE